MSSPTASPRPRSGFTLVEVVIVVLILAVIAAIVIPSLGSTEETQVVSAARALAADLETTRSLALTTQQPHSLVFNDDFSAYKVVRDYDGGAYASAVAIDHPVRRGHPMEVRPASLQGMAAVAVTAVDFDDDTYVTFDAQGEPAAGGTITVSVTRMDVDVTVEPLTGRVEVVTGTGN